MPSSTFNSRDSADPLLPGPVQHNNDQSISASLSDDDYEPSAPLGNMGVTYSTAKWLAPASFLYVFLFACKSILIPRLLPRGLLLSAVWNRSGKPDTTDLTLLCKTME